MSQLHFVLANHPPSDTNSDPPLRKWTIEIVLLGPHGEQLPANIFEKAVYKLHETFGDRQMQSMLGFYGLSTTMQIASCYGTHTNLHHL